VKIIVPFVILIFYVFFVVLILIKIHIWNLSNLKETIYWFIFSGAITVFSTIANGKVEKPIRKIVKGLITITIALEFIVNTYVFKLPIELVLVPILAILTMMYTYASLKAEYKRVEKFLGSLLAIIGIAILIQALIQVYQDFDKFGHIDTFIDFILPPILTISILPATYVLMLYSCYELIFTHINFLLDNDKEMRRYAKKFLILHYHFRVWKVKNMRGRVGRLYDGASKEDIKRILLNE
jgi:hypothetical protein